MDETPSLDTPLNRVGADRFYKEATLRICGTLDPKTALERSFDYIGKILPVDVMSIVYREWDCTALRALARVDVFGGRRLNDVISIPPEHRNILLNFGEYPFMLINDTSDNPVAHLWHTFYNDPISSTLLVPLIIDKQDIGAVALHAFGKNRYTEEHAHLFLQLKDPFAIAISNIRRHEEIIEMKNMLARENRYLREKLNELAENSIVGDSAPWRAVMEMVHLVGPLDSPVLLQGETGTGKEVIANAIHRHSPRKNGPFIKVNCGALPEGVLDSVLFGHEKGAFTGAVSSKKGLFERADQGTLFLDEIGDMPLHVQVRLLRVLQTQELERVGGSAVIPVNTRIIAACQNDLLHRVRANQFRADLWYRLNVFPVSIPPLRDRKGDIPALVRYFVKRKAYTLKMANIPLVRPGAMETLLAYDWPGNVRELENLIERSIILSRGEPLEFNSIISNNKSAELKTLVLLNNNLINVDVDKDDAADLYVNKQNILLHKPKKNSVPIGLDDKIKSHIENILEMTGGKIHGPGGAAEVLGVNANTLRSRMKKLGIAYKKRDKSFLKRRKSMN